jgi:hypothetical protein
MLTGPCKSASSVTMAGLMVCAKLSAGASNNVPSEAKTAVRNGVGIKSRCSFAYICFGYHAGLDTNAFLLPPMRQSLMPVGLLAASFLLISDLHAHDFWIEPDTFTPGPGAEVEVSLREGVEFKGDTVPYLTDGFVDFSQITDDGRRPVKSRLGDDPAATIRVSEGPLLLGYQSSGNYVLLEAEKFNKYLEDEGIEFLRDIRRSRGEDDSPAQENFYRCAKALMQVGGSGGDLYKTALGYTLELIPETDPYSLSVGDTLTFRVLLRDEPAAGLLVQAFNRKDPTQIEKVRVDEAGRAAITLSSAGVWLVKAVSIEAAQRTLDYSNFLGGPGWPGEPDIVRVGRTRPDALWQSYWASFLFELPG